MSLEKKENKKIKEEKENKKIKEKEEKENIFKIIGVLFLWFLIIFALNIE